jgi:uncharacterized OsmC-like protein
MGQTIRARVQRIDGLRSLVTVEHHAVIVDPPPEEGGTGTGMSAPQLLVAAVAGCIAGFIANSCRLRDIPLTRLEVELTAPIQTGPRRIGDMEAVIRMEPELSEEVRQHLLKVAKRAPLLNTLARPPQVILRFE